jgi:hypothetical protein
MYDAKMLASTATPIDTATCRCVEKIDEARPLSAGAMVA